MIKQRKQQFLAALGIQPLRTRTSPDLQAPTATLWRDMQPDFMLSRATARSISTLEQGVNADFSTDNPLAALQHVPDSHVANFQDSVTTPIAATTPPVPASPLLSLTARLPSPMLEHGQPLNPFEPMQPEYDLGSAFRCNLEGCMIGTWFILLNSVDLEAPDAQKLWQDIQKSMKATPSEVFQWPLSHGERWENTYAAAALAGFLYKFKPLAQQVQAFPLRLGVLGTLQSALLMQLDKRLYSEVVSLPSLADMLAEPVKKRYLWQTLSGLGNTAQAHDKS